MLTKTFRNKTTTLKTTALKTFIGINLSFSVLFVFLFHNKVRIRPLGFLHELVQETPQQLESDYNVIISLISRIHRGKNQGVLLSLSPKYKRIIDEGLKNT